MQEVFAVLIVVGAALFFGVRFFLRRKEKDREDMEDMRVSTEKLKEELGKSADTVIERMGIHVKHLEKLLAETEAKNVELTDRLRRSRQERLELEELCDRANMLLKKEQQREAQAAAPASPPPVYVQTETVQEAPAYRDPAAYAAAGDTAPVSAQPKYASPAQSLPSPQYEAPEPSNLEAMQPTALDTSNLERQDALDFASVLQQSIDRDAKEAEVPAYGEQEPEQSQEAAAESASLSLEQTTEQAAPPAPPKEEIPAAQYAIAEEGEPAEAQDTASLLETDAAKGSSEEAEEAASIEEDQEAEGVEPESTGDDGAADEAEEAEEQPPAEATVADRARALLLSGESIEEVSRETGMGMGALELLREMSRRELEKKN